MSVADQPRSGTTPQVDQLSFLDLLYAVPIGDLAVRVSGARLGLVTGADWAALAVVLAVIVFSWVGLHKDRAAIACEAHAESQIGEIRFASPEFPQFLIEVVIVGMYFAMGLTIRLPKSADPAPPPPSLSWLTWFLLLIYLAYLAWDLLDMLRAALCQDAAWKKRSQAGTLVTLGALPVWGVLYAAIRLAGPPGDTVAIWLCVLIIVLLYGYRVVQDSCGNTCK